MVVATGASVCTTSRRLKARARPTTRSAGVARAVLPPALVHTPRGDVIIIDDDGQELARTVGAAGTRTEKP